MKSVLPRVVVVGSFNMDLVVRTPRRPAKGETVFGSDFGMYCGGKGFNQAIAAARLGGEVTMIGRVGADHFGDLFLQALAGNSIRADAVTRDEHNGTGVGLPVIGADGDNSIVVVPRANMAMQIQDVEPYADQICQADILLLQLEIPQAVSHYAAHVARRAGVKVILNPAPASPLDDELYQLADVLVPNEQETLALTGILPADEQSLRRAASALLDKGARVVVLTLGARGAFLATSKEQTLLPGHAVSVVDTTGAGDAFCGALAVALARGASPADAVRFANAAGALSVTRAGASPSMPTAAQVRQLLGG